MLKYCRWAREPVSDVLAEAAAAFWSESLWSAGGSGRNAGALMTLGLRLWQGKAEAKMVHGSEREAAPMAAATLRADDSWPRTEGGVQEDRKREGRRDVDPR